MVVIKEEFRCRNGDKVYVRDLLAEARGDTANTYRVEEAGAAQDNPRPLVTGGPLAQLKRNTELYKQRQKERMQQEEDVSSNAGQASGQSWVRDA